MVSEFQTLSAASLTQAKNSEPHQQDRATSEISQVKIVQEKPAKQKSEFDFDFPDGGWVCSGCQNYNFLGRQKCNRCHKQKTKLDLNGKPKHLLKQAHKSSQQKKAVVVESASKPQVASVAEPTFSKTKKDKENSSTSSSTANPKKSFVAATQAAASTKPACSGSGERVGDWVCIACTNLNFAFRQVCNRCWRDRNQSATMVLQDAQEVQRFQSAGCTSSYLQISLGPDATQMRKQAQAVSRPPSEVFGTLNSAAACFKPLPAVQEPPK